MDADTAVAFDPFSVFSLEDPYPLYRALRDEAPVHYVEDADLWVVTRYDHCLEVLRDPELFSSKLGMRMAFAQSRHRQRTADDQAQDPFEAMGENLRVLIAIDPPDHVRLRRLLSRPFTPREIGVHDGWMRPLCEERFAALMDANAEGVADWVRDFTWPFPVLVIGELMGIPASMRGDFKRWSDDLIGTYVGGTATPGEERMASLAEMVAFFDAEITRRRSEPGGDLISMLIHKTEADEQPLTAEELVMFCVLLLVAGNETTTNLLSNVVKVMAADPTVLPGLQADPATVPPAVEEALRYESPVQAVPRATTRATELGGTRIPEEGVVLAYMGAANRDERHYADPDRFDTARNPVDHLGFGSGIHLCLGAPLARLEAQIALETLSRQVTTIELTGPPVPTGGLLLRGSSSMPVHLAPA
ncbi:MAG TPA: cytochrome P450 [Acidimicrobiales bacterium]|nr:cytochrome P450 [Acidimicrobiales bacterium]HUI04836.1 cytochrome P450 [Acidimicrobiales bacterium]